MSDPVEHDAAPLDASVDALSDVLDLIHLRGEALTVVHAVGGTDVRHVREERLLHIVEQGSVELLVDEGMQQRLGQGDMALLATGAAHRLRSVDGAAWMTGRFLVEENAASPLLAALPPVIVLRGSDAGLDWLPLSAGLLAAEIADPSAGSRAMASRLLDLLFIKALRAWSAADGAGGSPGWLTAALDRSLGPALWAMHRRPEQPWSVEELADLASMSRAAFAARFTRLVGDPPARYLARLRLARAADRLATTTEAVGSIGRTVGYDSEAAFSRAFTREYGAAPRVWRASRKG
ncbi:AraC family transcriptional regulator [Streptomyces sp. NPDC005813]|uniref:AraC family transcriptional regulator n=1 Tax=Streptomyces sp. NPDC005813 TaxID=3155592 RepID=UPI0033DA31A0